MKRRIGVDRVAKHIGGDAVLDGEREGVNGLRRTVAEQMGAENATARLLDQHLGERRRLGIRSRGTPLAHIVLLRVEADTLFLRLFLGQADGRQRRH